MKNAQARCRDDIKEFFDKMSREEFLRSLQDTEFDYYKTIKTPLFKVPQKAEVGWAIDIAYRSEFPCPVWLWQPSTIEDCSVATWRSGSVTRELDLTKELDQKERYDLAA